jgi:hypothetical protein
VEHGLSVIEHPAPGHGKHYGAWLGDAKPRSYQDELRAAIDEALSQTPATFEDFLSRMAEAGYTVSTKRKHVTFLLPGWGQPVRMDTLKGAHTEAAVRDRVGDIGDSASPVGRGSRGSRPLASKKPGLLIDIQSKLQQGKGEGYRRWATVFNLKQAAQTLIYLQEHGLDDYGALKEKTEAAAVRYHGLSSRIKGLEADMKSNAELQKHIINYSKTRDTYVAYRKAGYSKQFREQHETEILLHQAAKEAFDALGYGKDKRLPTIKTLRAEYAAALEEKKKAYAGYRAAKDEMRSLLTAKQNVDRLLNIPDDRREREPERTDL